MRSRLLPMAIPIRRNTPCRLRSSASTATMRRSCGMPMAQMGPTGTRSTTGPRFLGQTSRRRGPTTSRPPTSSSPSSPAMATASGRRRPAPASRQVSNFPSNRSMSPPCSSTEMVSFPSRPKSASRGRPTRHCPPRLTSATARNLSFLFPPAAVTRRSRSIHPRASFPSRPRFVRRQASCRSRWSGTPAPPLAQSISMAFPLLGPRRPTTPTMSRPRNRSRSTSASPCRSFLPSPRRSRLPVRPTLRSRSPSSSTSR